MQRTRTPFVVDAPPPIGSVVLTPTGRRAKVHGYDTDGRAQLKYQDVAPHLASVDLFPQLLRRIPH